MGIDYDGGMIVGEIGSKITVPEKYDGDIYEMAEDNDMEWLSMYYDADIKDVYFGFGVPDVPVAEMNVGWLDDISDKAAKFYELTGVTARLIGSQNIL